MRGAEGIALVVVAWGAVTFISCIALYAVESGINPSITSPLDALWWGVATISTVGYGDVTPVTPEGRLVAGVLMLFGIGLFGAITGIVTNTLLTASRSAPAQDLVGQLERLVALRSAAQLSPEQFEAAKARLLA
jgi:voltage-gated potassium channel